jgi:hypothetical protein
MVTLRLTTAIGATCSLSTARAEELPLGNPGAWQEALDAQAPWAFLRGCIRSDGCVFVNDTAEYAYESYDFSNLSRDILEPFAATCARVDVECRAYEKRARIYRRTSVELMLEHVGRKH